MAKNNLFIFEPCINFRLIIIHTCKWMPVHMYTYAHIYFNRYLITFILKMIDTK